VRAASGQAAAALPSSAMNFRRLMSLPMHQTELYHIEWDLCCASQQTWPLDFRSGSQADISLRPTNVRFTPKADIA
jgi:hypothetical protein